MSRESEEIGFVSYASPAGESHPQGWVFSTGCTIHVCNSKDKFQDYRPVTGKHVSEIFGSKVNVSGIGSVTLKLTSGKTVTLLDVAHIPSSVTNFVSVGRLSHQGFEVTFDDNKALIYKNNEFVGNACVRGGVFMLDVEVDNHEGPST